MMYKPKYLKRQVRRNIERFPQDFMFELNKSEFEILRSQIGTSRWGGTRYMPLAFTEQGVAQLSSVIKSERAIKVNIQIIRLFTQMRKLLLTHKDLILKVEKLEQNLNGQNQDIKILFQLLKKLMKNGTHKTGIPTRKRIGF